MTSFIDGIATAGFAAGMTAIRLSLWRRFHTALRAPVGAQTALLRGILAANAETTIGRRYGFDRVDGYAAFRARLPVTAYEDLRPLIETQAETGEPSLTRAPPVFYARTSATTGAAKLVPVTAEGFSRQRDIQRIFAFAQYHRAETFTGRILAIAGAAVEGRTRRGVPIGSTTGAFYAQMPSLVRRRYIVPAEVMTITDYGLRDYVIALLGLQTDEVSALAAANPSSLVRLRQVIEQNWDQLLDDLGRGRLGPADRLDDAQRQAVEAQLRAGPRRARALKRYGAASGPISFHDIWPRLKSVVTWTGGSCGYALDALRPHLTAGARVFDAGYQASECRGTVNVDPLANACVPALTCTFFEFVERAAWDDGRDCFLTIEEIEEGREYYVFVTTLDGLYRYNMNDIVRVTGSVAATPTLTFVQKGRGVTNITGEKLSEAQALLAVREAAAARGLGAPFFLLLADEARATYQLFIETGRPETASQLAAEVDATLGRANIEYAAKRASRRLQPITGIALRPGTGEAYRRFRIAGGQREAQFKIEHLQYRRQVDFDLDRHTVALS